ncbi:NlpC/P60 family protein [Indiicoccus explosivorum]|uniref:C40 family peptidase n=1 Tax=Indiicoccus explosivorum TaxID=1917864 RepID=UPI000B43D305|nr:peptidoglycan endopeptidase [Indiicoccus explosivorum]
MRRFLLSATAALVLCGAAAGSAAASGYTVQAGDTLYSIGRKANVSVTNLKIWNGLSSDLIYVNQRLQTSAPQTGTVEPLPAPAPAQSADSHVYVIQRGDTLYGISRKFSVSILDLVKWNRLKSPSIFAGRSLIVGEQAPVTAEPPLDDPAPETGADDGTDAGTGTDPQPEAGTAPIVIPPGQTLTATAGILSLYTATLKTASGLAGTPYKFGGVTPLGFDCSGFIYYVHHQAGLPIYRNSSAGYYSQATPIANPVPGDLVFFQNTYKPGVSHMGIFIGGRSFIHSSSNGVEVSSLDTTYWKERFSGFRRFNAVLSIN